MARSARYRVLEALLRVPLAAAIGAALLLAPAVVARLAIPSTASIDGAGDDPAKAALSRTFEREYTEAAQATLGPIRGRPEEEWHPVIVEGIDDAAESPFEGSPFVLMNMWQSSLAADGTVTRAYAGLADGVRPVVILVRQELMSGIEQMRREFSLPVDVGRPRFVTAAGGILTIGTDVGRDFRFDAYAQTLTSSP